jgi:predicted dehydrogenase
MPSVLNISRRAFLAQLSVFAGALSWIPMLVEAADRSKTSGKVRVGIIGVGSRGSKLLLHLQTIPQVKIVAVCDTYQPHLYGAKKMTDGHARTYQNYQDLLDQPDVDAVVIATPPSFHASITCDALGVGKHVFCEKVMALTLDDCKKMMRVQKETGRILQIGFQRLFDVRTIKAYEAIRQGKVGTLTCLKTHWHRNDSWRRTVKDPTREKSVNWRLYNDASGGLMAELASHQIVISNWILGAVPESVTGLGGINYWNDGRETHDNVSVIFRFPNGVLLNQTCILSNQHYGVVEQFMGSKGTIELEAGKLYLESQEPSPGIYQLIQSIEEKVFRTIPIGGASWVLNNNAEPKAEHLVEGLYMPSPTQLELEAFVESVSSNKLLPDLLDQSYQASVAVILANEAINRGKIVHWPQENM